MFDTKGQRKQKDKSIKKNRECDCHHAHPSSHQGVATHAPAGLQSRRHSPTARSSQRHVPWATTARASQEEEDRGKSRGQVNKQEVDQQKQSKEKTKRVKQVSAEVTRWKQIRKISLLWLFFLSGATKNDQREVSEVK